MKVTVENNELVIRLPYSEAGRPSKSGGSMVHASTGGNKETDVLVNGKKLTVGVNAYTKIA